MFQIMIQFRIDFTIDPRTGIKQNSFNVNRYQNYTVTVAIIGRKTGIAFKTGNLNNPNRYLPSGVHIVNIITPEKKLIRKYS